MIRTVAMVVLIGAAVPCEAGSCRTRAQAVAVQALAVVPFAVPVGMPVAPLGTVSYSYASAGTAAPVAPQAAGCPCGCHAGEPAAGPAAPQPVGPEPIEPAASESPGLAILRERCAKCHTGETAKGGTILFGAAGEWFVGAPGRDVFAAIRDGKMPKGGPPLTGEEFTDVVDWLLGAVEPAVE